MLSSPAKMPLKGPQRDRKKAASHRAQDQRESLTHKARGINGVQTSKYAKTMIMTETGLCKIICLFCTI